MPINHHAEGIYRALLLSATVGIFEFYSPVAGKITRVDFIAVTGPTGADAVFDVNTHATPGATGVTIFTDQSLRPKILNGATSGNRSGLAAVVTKGQRLTVDADVVPSALGQSLVCIVAIEEAATRQTYIATTGSIADGDSDTLILTLGRTFVILSIETDVPAWVVVYDSVAAQTADVTRTILEDPVAGSGVLAEVVTTVSLLTIVMSPQPIGSDLEAVPTGDINITVTNLSGSTDTITVTITSLELEL